MSQRRKLHAHTECLAPAQTSQFSATRLYEADTAEYYKILGLILSTAHPGPAFLISRIRTLGLTRSLHVLKMKYQWLSYSSD